MGTPYHCTFECLSHQTHPIQSLAVSTDELVSNQLLDEGDIQNMPWWGIRRTGLTSSDQSNNSLKHDKCHYLLVSMLLQTSMNTFFHGTQKVLFFRGV